MWAPVEGKYGRARDGRKVGPMEAGQGGHHGYFFAPGVFQFNRHGKRWPDNRQIWDASGAVHHPTGDFEEVDDLVAEWVDDVDGLVRQRIVTEIVPGVYDGVEISEVMRPDCDNPDRQPQTSLDVRYVVSDPTADELDAAARVLTQLAEALRHG